MARHILVVDDEPALLRFVQRTLKEAGFSVVAEGDGEGAVSFRERHTEAEPNPVPAAPASGPTRREMQILKMICQGYSSKTIAGLLNVRFKTITCHRQRLLRKANVRNSVELFRWALRNGYASLDEEPAELRARELGAGHGS
ncbi:MAG: response regulator transcription factor [Acidobacteriia bacterium]|nr:response regulator transcription factor [Terriglobia bacterium]